MSDDDELETRSLARVGMVLRQKYRLDRLLGVGGMAAVYAATHLRNANRVAVKILHREIALDASIRHRFVREGYAANSIEHTSTVRILDDDTAEDGSTFLVMELLDGHTLEALWQRAGQRLPVNDVVPWMLQLLDVLAALHARDIIHRDIKPENIFLTSKGQLKLLDFGIARLREMSPQRTRSGAVFGTPAFMPPEQALGQTNDVDARSDLWAVGATAFTLLSGRLVHPGNTAQQILVHAATRAASSLATVVAGVPPPIAAVIDRALASSKEDRWPSAEAMRDALGHAVDALMHGAEAAPAYVEELPTRVAAPPKMTLPARDESTTLPRAPSGRVAISRGAELTTVSGVSSDSQSTRRRRGILLATVVTVASVCGGAAAVVARGGLAPVPPTSAPGAVELRGAEAPTLTAPAQASTAAVVSDAVAGQADPSASSSAGSAATDAAAPRPLPRSPARPAPTPTGKRDPFAP